jgi:hypothetical protein
VSYYKIKGGDAIMKKRKIISVFITFAVILLSFSQIAFADGWTSKVNPNGGAGTSEATKAMNIIIGIFQAVAVGVAAVMLIALAIKYMSAAPGEKAEIKKHAIVYIVGAVMAFGSAGVVQLLRTFANEILK